MTDRAVSEVIAFILVFSIVITSVGLLYTVGFGSLGQFQQVEQDRSAEQAFEAVAVGFDDVQRGHATVRQMGLDLSGRSLFVDRGEELTVDVGNDGTTDANATGALVYGRGEDTEIAYQAGGVVRSEGDDAQLMRRAPRFRCTDDHAVVSLVEVTDPVNTSVSSSDNVQVEAQLVDPDGSRLVPVDQTASSVAINYSSSQYDNAWSRYFSSDDNWSDHDGTAVCDSLSEGVYVRKTVLELRFVVG